MRSARNKIYFPDSLIDTFSLCCRFLRSLICCRYFKSFYIHILTGICKAYLCYVFSESRKRPNCASLTPMRCTAIPFSHNSSQRSADMRLGFMVPLHGCHNMRTTFFLSIYLYILYLECRVGKWIEASEESSFLKIEELKKTTKLGLVKRGGI